MTRIVALGGTVNPGSSTEQALRLAASIAEADGAEVTVFGGEYLTALPHYLGPLHDPSQGAEMVAAVRAADGKLWLSLVNLDPAQPLSLAPGGAGEFKILRRV